MARYAVAAGRGTAQPPLKAGLFNGELKGTLAWSLVAHGVMLVAVLFYTPVAGFTRVATYSSAYTVTLVEAPPPSADEGTAGVSKEPSASSPSPSQPSTPPAVVRRSKPDEKTVEKLVRGVRSAMVERRKALEAQPARTPSQEKIDSVPRLREKQNVAENSPGRQEPLTIRRGSQSASREEPAKAFQVGAYKGSLVLDTSNFPYPYYLQAIQNRISENWRPPAGEIIAGQVRKVVIRFRVSRTGQVTSTGVENSSGVDLIDQSALRAVLASKLPPLPTEFAEEFLGVHFGFEYIGKKG